MKLYAVPRYLQLSTFLFLHPFKWSLGGLEMLTMMFRLSWGFSRVFNIMNMFANLFSLICINLRLWTSFALDKVTNRSCARGPLIATDFIIIEKKKLWKIEISLQYCVETFVWCLKSALSDEKLSLTTGLSSVFVIISASCSVLFCAPPNTKYWSSDDIFINCQDINFTLNIFNL